MTDAEKKDLDAAVAKLYRGKHTGRPHERNFFECVKDRTLPISDIFTHHRSMTSCHMCNIALLLKRKLQWDPEGGEIRRRRPGECADLAAVAEAVRGKFVVSP